MLDFGFYHANCMEHMKEFPDEYFDLAIVDPPYGGGGTKAFQGDKYDGRFGHKNSRFEKYREIKAERRGCAWAAKYGNHITEWDVAPDQEYFDELFRISKNQVIWGGNYFDLPPTRCFLIWRKTNIPLKGFTMSPVEYAWTSFNENAHMFEKSSMGSKAHPRFHPTQKPIDLYLWCLGLFAHEGDKILDTHVGSASSLIACEQMGYQYVGFEVDDEYYGMAKERLDQERAQLVLHL